MSLLDRLGKIESGLVETCKSYYRFAGDIKGNFIPGMLLIDLVGKNIMLLKHLLENGSGTVCLLSVIQRHIQNFKMEILRLVY
ncbi:MAG: hypothetical protein AABX51_06615 [Nanoarchaeota archaeon]